MTSVNSNTYTHLSPAERGQIQALSEAGLSMRKIALKLERNASTISRELKRNRTTQLDYRGKYFGAYFADTAQIYYHKRRQACHAKDYCLKAQDFFNQLTLIIKNPFRDDGIDGFIANYKRMYPSCPCPSTPTVYRLIDQGKLAIKNGDLPRKVRLRHSGHHRKRTRQHKKRLGNSIEQRPKAADERSEAGHFEGDLVKGIRRATSSALLTLTDRKTRFEIVIKIPDYKADTCFEAVQKAVNEHPSWFKTITFDNGSEFARVDEVKGVDVYFAHPYTPSERGSNENANGLLREFFPKGKTMAKVTDEYVKRAQNALNNKHRRILGYQTAREVFMSEIA